MASTSCSHLLLIQICEGVYLNINSSPGTIFNSAVDIFVSSHCFHKALLMLLPQV